MTIYIGADHRGYELKNELLEWLEEEGHEVHDCGNTKMDKNDDYPEFAISVAESVALDEDSLGIFLCGSGVGGAIAANRVQGIYAAQAMIPEQAKHARSHDGANLVSLAADYLTVDEAKEVVSEFISTRFQAQPRMIRRLKQIDRYENLS